MALCKMASQSDCGQNICCFNCSKQTECDDRCSLKSNEGCPNMYSEDELVDLNKQVPDVIKAIADICTQKKQLDEQEKLMKKKLQEAMEQYGVKKFENDIISVTYVAPATRTSIDSDKLKKEHPEIVQQYSKTTNVSASIRISVK